jgi:3-methyl-2-oxobutanoate hydroxymethyltransferase
MALKRTVLSIVAQKEAREKIVCVTAYDYTSALIADRAGVDLVLVGDSLAQTIKGEDDTLNVTVEEVAYHSRGVRAGLRNALLVADMPFLSYHVSEEESVKNAARLVTFGRAACVKLEGGSTERVRMIKAICEAEIPVMGHIGLTPQSSLRFGGFKYQGKSDTDSHWRHSRQRVLDDALRIGEAGVFAMVLEGIPAELADEITKNIAVPTIGIGAGNGCDGQILVWHDLLGMSAWSPKFVKRFANLGSDIESAVKLYINEVRRGEFPSPEFEI